MGKGPEYDRRSVLGFGLAGALAATGLMGTTPSHAAGLDTTARPDGADAAKRPSRTVRTAFGHDAARVLRNPLNGWVLYSTATPAPDYWERYDNMAVPGIEGPVKVSDYAPTLYMRLAWSVLNPAEGVYGWEVDEQLKGMIAEARSRDMRLAFRIVVDSRDKPRGFTPDYVRAAGAQGYESTSGSQTLWSPYPDDPVFQEKYETFLTAFAARFGDPSEMDFIDGYGLGKWGEGHSMLYLDPANREAVWDWNIDLYTRLFPRVPLSVNYHRLIGAVGSGWGLPTPRAGACSTARMRRGGCPGTTPSA